MYRHKKNRHCYYKIKHLTDIFIGSILSILMIPIFLIIGIIIVIEDGFPVIFKQKRFGINQSFFEIYKFRTMKRQTPHDCPTHLLKDPDQYLTKVGRFLRQYSLDELPQFINIAKGEMSLVGPRPALWNQLDLIRERERYGANSIFPGLTGWAQIHGRDTLAIKDKAAYDGYYVQNLSFFLDLKCILGTVIAVLERKGFMEGGTGIKDRPVKHKLIICTNHSYMFYQFHRELIEALADSYRILLSTPFTGHIKELTDAGANCKRTVIDRRGCNPLKDARLLIDYLRLFRREKPKLVITYSIKPNIYAGIICRILNIPYCAAVQGLGTAFQKERMANWVTILYRYALKKAAVIFFENPANAHLFLEKGIADPGQIKVLPGAGVNLCQYAYHPFCMGRNVTRFLYLGRLMKEKGIDELLTAFYWLHRKYGNLVILDIVGFFEEAYRDRLHRLTSLGMIVFHGFQKDPIPFYSNADCILLPSYHEGMSNVLLEAAAIGRPVIASDIPGCREAVLDQISGYLCQPRNPQSLYQKMDAFMQLDENRRIVMGLAGRQHMETHFDRRNVVTKTYEILRSVTRKEK